MTGVSPTHIPASRCYFPPIIKNGGNNRARTYDPLLVRQMLSQLSYASIPAVFSTAEVIISQDFLIVNSFFAKFLIFLLFCKHFFNIITCEDVFFVTKTAIYLEMFFFSLGELFREHLMKLGLSKRNECSLHSIS